jgi:hypothetical protein
MNLLIRFTAVCLSTCLLTADAAVAQSRQGVHTVVVKRGTALKFWLVNSLDSSTAKIGDDVTLRLARPLTVNGIVLLYPDALAHGRVTRVKRAGSHCRRGAVNWEVDSIQFSDSSSVETEKTMELPGDYDLPETYPSQAIRRGHHNTWKWIVRAPVIAVAFPVILGMAMTMESHKCESPGSEYRLSANATIEVVTVKNHRVHY